MRKDTRKQLIFKVSVLAVFLGIEALVCFVPFLGSIQIGPVAATLAMIPVVIIGCTMGPICGSILGFFAGLFSFIWWTFVDPGNLAAIMFTPWNAYTSESLNLWPLVICFVPRILTGFGAGWCTIGLKKLIKVNFIVYSISCVVGSLINTFLVVIGTYFLLGKNSLMLISTEYSTLITFIASIVGINGVFEAALSGILGGAISKSIDIIKK